MSGGTIRTFMIADVRGYTSYTQTYGDEAAARLAAGFAGDHPRGGGGPAASCSSCAATRR